MMHLLAVRRRYVGMRKALPCDCAFDLDLHEELTQAIRRLDRMIEEVTPDQTAAGTQRRRARTSRPGTGAPSS